MKRGLFNLVLLVTALIGWPISPVSGHVLPPKLPSIARGGGEDLQTKLYHARSGLVYFGARWYSPSTGTWLSRDPIGVAGGLNLYTFVGNDPINRRDPWGLRDYTADQTQMILRNAMREYKLSSWGSALLQARANHGVGGKYDYIVNSPSDTFLVGGHQLAADQFGNYIAGYATYGRFGEFGLTLTRLAGDWFELWKTGNEFWLDDPGSTEMISQGAYDFFSQYRYWDDLGLPSDVWKNLYDDAMSDGACK